MHAPNITFTTNPDSHHQASFGKLQMLCVPQWFIQVWRDNFPRSTAPDEKIRQKLSQPLVLWMMRLAHEIQELVPSEGEFLSFEFAYYVHIGPSREDDENTTKTSLPIWLLTVRNRRNKSTHKNWTIAIDGLEGDPILQKGVNLLGGDGSLVGGEARKKILHIIRAHLLRLKHT